MPPKSWMPALVLAALAAFAWGCATSPVPEPGSAPATPGDAPAGTGGAPATGSGARIGAGAVGAPADTGDEGDRGARGPAAGAPVGAPPAARRPAPDLQRVMLDVLGAVNESRGAAGLRPLALDPALLAAARRYSQELATRRQISHYSTVPGLRTFRERMAAAGARARLAGENLARLTSSPETLPENVVNAWLRSPGHRRNLLDPAFSRTGIGVVLGDDGVWYVTQLYATPD